MFIFTYRCMHLPEKCKCATHEKVFRDSEQTMEVSGHHEAMQLLLNWNGGKWDCWAYSPVSLAKMESLIIVRKEEENAHCE